jgi:hypothetical protein
MPTAWKPCQPMTVEVASLPLQHWFGQGCLCTDASAVTHLLLHLLAVTALPDPQPALQLRWHLQSHSKRQCCCDCCWCWSLARLAVAGMALLLVPSQTPCDHSRPGRSKYNQASSWGAQHTTAQNTSSCKRPAATKRPGAPTHLHQHPLRSWHCLSPKCPGQSLRHTAYNFANSQFPEHTSSATYLL